MTQDATQLRATASFSVGDLRVTLHAANAADLAADLAIFGFYYGGSTAPEPKAEPEPAPPAPKAKAKAKAEPKAAVAEPAPAPEPAPPWEPEPASEPASEPKAEVPDAIDYATLQAATLKLVAQDRPAAVALVARFGVKTFRDLPEAKWAEALAAVNEALAAGV